MADTNAESSSTSLVKQGGKSRQHLGLVAAPLTTQTELESLKKELMVLTVLFHELLNNTMSPDVRELSVFAACKRLARMNCMSEEEAEKIANKFMSIRQKSVIDGMF